MPNLQLELSNIASATVAMNMTTTMMMLHTILRVMFPLKQPSENFQNISTYWAIRASNKQLQVAQQKIRI